MSLSALIIIIVVAIVLLVLISLSAKTNSKGKGVDSAHFKNEWNDCIALFNDEKTRGLAVINADKLFDEALKCLGYDGETMAERLVSAKQKIRSKDDIWAAHKLRNKLVHETNYKPNAKTIKQALNSYYKAFNDLGVF